MLPADRVSDAAWRVREKAETDWSHGQPPEQRSLEDRLANGLVIIDKPDGPTSQDVSLSIKEKLGRQKTGHAGTLDADASGVLPVGLNQGTKILHPLGLAGKEYSGTMELDDEYDIDTIAATGNEFVGTVEQTPPPYAAVNSEPRDRKVYDLSFESVDGREVTFTIQCQHGFYIRTFCEDFGEALGTSSEMTALQRTRVGVFDDDQAVTVDEIASGFEQWVRDEDPSVLDDIVLPVEAGIRHLRKILVKDSAVAAVAHGADLGSQGISRLQEGIEEGEMVALLSLKGELIALGTAVMDTETMLEERDTAVELERVFMDNDLYPKEW